MCSGVSTLWHRFRTEELRGQKSSPALITIGASLGARRGRVVFLSCSAWEGDTATSNMLARHLAPAKLLQDEMLFQDTSAVLDEEITFLRRTRVLY